MSILNIVTIQTGLVGVLPSLSYIYTNDPKATVITAGYLNKEVANGTSFSLPCLAIVSTQESPSSPFVAGVYNVVHSGTNWSLAASSNDIISLPNGQIFVGNASNIATPVSMSGLVAITNAGVTSIPLVSGNILVGSAGGIAASVAMSGDATIIASGAMTIANNAITTAKILNANVTLAKLAAGITPSHVIKFANQVTTSGGAASEAFTVTGAVGATDTAFCQTTNNGTNNTTILEAVVTDNTLTVTFSADPGANATFNYQIIRPAS